MQRNQLLKSQTTLNKTTTHRIRHPVASYSNHHQLQATVANNLSQLENQTLLLPIDRLTSSKLFLDFFQSAMLTSSLLLVTFSSRYADVIIADTSSCATDSRLLLFIFFFDISSSRLHRFCSRSHFRMRPVLFPPKRSNEKDSLYADLSKQIHQARNSTSWYQTQNRNDVAPTNLNTVVLPSIHENTKAPADHNTLNQTSCKRRRFRNLALKHASAGFITDQLSP
ncbi:transcription factor JUNGBRUNNEN 1-like [Dorcoceras hygrometricum]|uniref:Transcription factor JUNGBRUNNEN 1-like n=1 Tax=Dorcoceras hygrometricum TaxID=472368 RepID=A0A2Z7DFE1_9LAMI|nr:transcription factor JUNGBRUNNEN 1-like [Dorcoceras hygrometricum]